jgi:RNA polymerase sigma-70 factor (ECF subfamily)
MSNSASRGPEPTRYAPSQRQLMNELAVGNQAAFAQIYDQLNLPTQAICRHYLSTPDAVNEAMLGLWLDVWQNAATLAGLPGSPWSIIIETAERHARYHARTEALARASICDVW